MIRAVILLYHGLAGVMHMTTATLRKWGGAVAVSLPKKVLALLGLDAGALVEVTARDGKIILSPARPAYTLKQLLKEQQQLERKLGQSLVDRAWLDTAARGKELL
jgi:antitoxin MazE